MNGTSVRAGTIRAAGATAGARARGAWERAGLVAILVLAAALRLPNLATRGRFEFDQAGDLLILRAFVHDGVIPLLGPKASVGDFHHGALTFYLLAPAAWLSGTDPVAVTAEIALLGILAVLATWWTGRVMGGPIAGLVAALLLALSPAAIDESSFIWNPNPIPLFAALAAGTAWRAHETGRARWWVLAFGSAGAVAQLHVLGLLFVVPILGLWVWDVSHVPASATSPGPTTSTVTRRPLVLGLVGGLVVIGLLFLPLAIHELTSGFSETQAVLRYLGSPGDTTLVLPARLLVTLLRVIGWPIVGLVTDAPSLSSLVVAIVVGLLVAAVVLGRRTPLAGTSVRAGSAVGAASWILLALAWAVVGLAVGAPQLANVVPGLPNDHYHAFADPLVVVGVALAGLLILRRATAGPGIVARSAGPRIVAGSAGPRIVAGSAGPRSRPAGLLVALGALVLLGFGLGVEAAREPRADPNGGWAAANAAGARIVRTTGSSPVLVAELPTFEPADTFAFPLVQAGATLDLRPAAAEGVTFDPAAALEAGPAMLQALDDRGPANQPTPGARYLILGCDRLFVAILGAECAGPAEVSALPDLLGAGAAAAHLVDRFDLGSRWSVSIYDLVGPP